LPEIADVRAWREAAIKDGWAISPLYHGEDFDHSCRLAKEGFLTQIVSGSIMLWGPDGLIVDTPWPYSWIALVSGLEICGVCGARGKTVRVGFAHRVCPECRAKRLPKDEPRGWTA
jgi:hypothetical protein